MDQFNLSLLLGEASKHSGGGGGVAFAGAGVMTCPEVTYVAVECSQGQSLYTPWNIRELERLACGQTPSVPRPPSAVTRRRHSPLPWSLPSWKRLASTLVLSFRTEMSAFVKRTTGSHEHKNQTHRTKEANPALGQAVSVLCPVQSSLQCHVSVPSPSDFRELAGSGKGDM